MNHVLETQNLTKRFGRKNAVDNVSMTIRQGDIYGFIGKNGAGKTTFMRLVLGLANPTSGSISLFEGIPKEEALRKTGSLIEAAGFYKNCTAFENLKRFSILSGGNESDERLHELLSIAGIADTGKKKAGQFSLGMKQRLGIAIAMLGNPEFLVLDEPVNGLDPAGIKEVRDMILELNKNYGVTFLISSHLLDELSKVVTRYGIINEGILIEEIASEELHSRCRHQLVIAVDSTEKAAAVLQSEFPELPFEVREQEILLSDRTEESSLFNHVLSSNGIFVNQIYILNDSLENYFIERIGK